MIRQKPVLFSVICFTALALLLSTSQPLNRAAGQSLEWAAGSDLLGQIGGGSYAVDYAGGFIYLGVGPRVYIYNAFNLNSPYRVAVSALLPGIVQDIKAAGDYLFATLGEGGLAVLNVSIKSAPVVVSIYDTPGFAKGLWLANEYLYVADGTNGVVKLNVSTPPTIQLTATFDKSSNARDVMVSNPNGSDDKLFIADGSAGILALRPTDGEFVDVVDSPGFAEALAIIPPNIYLADGSSGVELYQFTAQNTFRLDTFIYQNDTPGYAQDVIANEPLIYIADGTGGFTVFNRIPDALLYKGNYNSPGISSGLDLQLFGEDIYLFLADYSGMQVIALDVTNPYGFGPYNDTPVPARAAVSGTNVYAADPWLGLHIIDTTDPTQPVLKGSLGYETVWGVNDVAVVDPYAYLADGADGLRIVDISNPAAPVLTQTIDTPGDAVGVTVEGGLAYIADGSNGLVEINLSDPSIMRNFVTSGYASDVVVAGDYAYLAAGESGLLIINRLPDGDLTLVSSLDTAGVATNLAYKDGLIFLADGAKGLRIIDVTNPTYPIEIGYYDPARDVVDAAVWERWVFVAEKDHGVSAFDITVPSRPSLVKFYDTPGAASGVAVDDRGVYIADEQGGLLIYQLPPQIMYLPMIVR